MAEIQDDKERKKLYGLLVSDPATRKNTAQYSFKQWESKLLGDEENIKRVADYAVKKNWSYDQDDFFRKYAPEKIAKPQPKVQAAPAMQMAAPMEEEEAYTPPPQPLVGTPEYDVKLQKQYGGMAPTLGATFGGTPASFETKAQKKQEQISPVFKAQQLAFEDVPIAEEQRRAQRQFAKAEKQQQQAALRGGTGFEYQQEQKNKERGYGAAKAEDLLGSITSGGERIAKNVLSGIAWLNQASMAADPNMPLEYEQRQQQIKDASQRMYDASASSQNQFQEELAKRNIQTSILDAIDKGNYGRIPEATLYTIGDAAMQIIPSILTMGGSTYFQTLPEAYKNGVDAIAKEKGMSPEQVIASGDDALLTAQISSGIQSALERVGAGLVSKSIASRGGYKAMRDWLLKQGVNRNLARGASLLGVSGGEAITEYGQEGTAQIGEIAAKSPTAKAFMDKLPKELFTPEATKRRAESLVGGLVGGFGLAGGGQAFQSAMDRTLFEAPVIGKATQRPDMDIVLTDDKLQQRKKLNQAMESAIKANPEAEGQIRERYRKLNDALELTDNEVLSAYDGISQLPPSPEKDRMLQDLEAYMAEKGITPQVQAETVTAEEVPGEGYQIAYAKTLDEIPEEYRNTAATVERGTTRLGRFGPTEKVFAYRVPNVPLEAAPEATTEEDIAEDIPFEELPPAPTETAPLEEAPVEEAIQEDEDLASLGQTISGLEQAPVEEVAQGQDGALDVNIGKNGVFEGSLLNNYEFLNEGSEHIVYRSNDGTHVIKIAEPYNDKSDSTYNKRIDDALLINEIVGDKSLEVIGYYLSPNGTKNPIFRQEYQEGTPISEQDASKHLSDIGGIEFGDKYGKGYLFNYNNKWYKITDLTDNFFRTPNGEIVAIDAGIEEVSQEEIDNAYQKAKKDGSNPKLIEAVEGKQAAPVAQAEEVAPEVAPAAPAPKGKKKAAPVTPAALPKELLGKTTVSSTGFGGDREHTTGKVSLEDLKVLDVGIETARQTLKTDKSFKPSREPIVVGVDVNTGEKQLLDGYHRYLLKSGKGEVPAKFIPMKNGEIISFEEAKAAPVTPAPAAPKKEEAPKPEPKKEETPTETKPSSTTPQAGSVGVGGDVELKNDIGDRKSIIYKGEKVGYIEVPTDLESDTISLGDINIKPEFRNKGIGVEVYKILIKQLDKPLESLDRTPEAKRVWDSLLKQGLAKKEGNRYVSVKAVQQSLKETPQEGTTVEIAPQREGGSPRKMVFKDGEWKQNVGGDIVKVGPSVQQQAQEMFGGKAEAKPAETKAEPTAKKIDKKSVQDSLEKAKEEYEKAKGAFDKKRSELDKTTREDVKDLFGERKVEMKAKGLFEMPRISPEQRERAIQPFRNRMNKAKEEVNRLTKMLEEGEEAAKELTFEKQKEYEQVQGVSKETRKEKSTPKAERVVRPKAKPIRNAGKTPDAITARNIAFYGDPVATTLQYLMDATYHPDLLEGIFGGPSKTTKSGRKDISGERRSRIQFLDNNSNVKTADKLAEVLAERYAEENSIDVKDAEQQHDFASIATDIVSSYSSRSQMVRELLRLNDQQSEAFDFMYNPEEIYGEGYNEDIAKDIDGILDELPDSYWEGKEISDEDFGNLFAEEVEPITKAEKKYAKSKEEGGGLQVNETPNGVPYLSQSGGAEYEVPNGLQWEGNKLGGNFLDVISVWNETNYINFNGGAYVKDASDVAEIMSLLENKSVEHSFAVHVDKNEVPHIQFLNIGITSAAHFNAQAVLAGVKKFNSKKVYLVHNHPSGNLKLSEQDKKVTQNAQKLLEPLGVVVNHVVLNTYKKEYSVYENFDGMYLTTEGIPRKKDGGKEKLTTHIFNEQKVLSVPQKIVKSSQDAATFIQQIRLTALPKNAVLLLSQSNEIIGNYVFPDNINYKELTDIISESGIVQGLIFYGNQNNIAEISEIKERLSNATIRVLDLLIVSSDSSSIVGYYESAADQGLLNDVQEKYGTNSVPSPSADFTSKQESSASQEFDGMKKHSKIKTKSFDGKHGKGAFERMKNITDNFEDIMDGMSGKIKQDCL